MPDRMERKRRERGNNILEFALVAMPTVLLMLGVVVLGVDLARSVEVAQVARDGGAMFVRGLDFSQTGNQQVLVRISGPLNLQTTGGDGIATMSKITFIPDASCGAPTDASYPNCIVGKNVLMLRVIFGNTALPGTHYATAGSVTLDSQGNVANYATDANAVVSNFTGSLQLKPLEVSYVTEVYFQTPDVNMQGFLNNTGIYSQAFF
jgi:hypothetical protein